MSRILNILDYYTKHSNDLTWIVARTFEDNKTKKIYFVNPLPPSFEEDHNFSVTYANGTIMHVKLEGHLLDWEVPFSIFKQSQPKYTAQTQLSRVSSGELEESLGGSLHETHAKDKFPHPNKRY